MTISSTEFQQNIGKYLAMAEKGIPVVIERQKPRKSRFRLTKDKMPSSKDRADEKEFKAWLKSFQELELIYPDEDAVAYQRRMRS